MRQDSLTHTLTVRVPPSLRDELAAEAERNDETVGALVRRAARAELGDAEARRLDPWINLPHGEAEEILIRVLQTCGNPEDVVKDRHVVVQVAREHCAGRHLIIGPKADWLEADFNLAAEVTERTWSRSLQVCETCGRQSAEGTWSRYRTRCAEHAEVR
ncbi:YlcI/YnfO family protein [Methylobacterium oxalidis]|uniref:Uncharacterized protein n=1 Tax=Methylobacterium oxalidis TaxID=944322 RepID=A0A512JA21_9HYPH|nr:YlcI/YnfO family protein [Methylobacterium oxalidis]GEP06775.1 hypothetical protein MOX02_48130 [Methylobacterium oxalidis]GJE33881.1 hypothetical protein LDDCCGHA_4085 [Methylobacterium oxalidis]GLS67983.1 hypothetical protein GCM10007888_63680 [Methylobacterium oxalidis]